MNSSTMESRAPRIAGSNTGFWMAVLAKRLRRLFARIRSQHRIRRDIEWLKKCDERMLADIGLSHGEVEHAVRYGRLPYRRDSHPRR